MHPPPGERILRSTKSIQSAEKAFPITAGIGRAENASSVYLPITSEADLTANLRRQLERLNKITFSEAEWDRFLTTCIAGANDGIVDKTSRIQEDHIQGAQA